MTLKKTASLVILTCILALGSSVPAVAQERTDYGAYATEFSVMYSFLRDDGVNGNIGMLVDFGKHVLTLGKLKTSLVAEVGVNKFAGYEETYTTAAGALRFGAMASDRVRPFFQVLVGVQHAFGRNGFNVQPGAGLNIRLGKNIDAKLQADMPIVRWFGSTYKEARVSAGLGIPLGGR